MVRRLLLAMRQLMPWYSQASTVRPSSAVGALHRRRDVLVLRRRCDFLCPALIHIGVLEHHARRFAGQSMRSGGATAAAISGLSPAEICHLAGVKDVDWLSYYNRNHLSSRLRASRAVGL